MRSATSRTVGIVVPPRPAHRCGGGGRLPACLFVLAVLVAATPGRGESPVFDDDELAHGFVQRLAQLAGGDDAFTGDRAVAEARAATGRAVDLGGLDAAAAARPGTLPLYEAVVPAVVAVSSIHTCPRCSDWHLGGSGSGWILSPDGLIVTNHHVIRRDKGHRLGVMTADGEVYAVTGVVAADPIGDAVVIRIDTRGRRLPYLRLGASPACGTPVSVVSHPVGRFWCLTEGVVSRFHRQHPSRDDMAAAATDGEPATGEATDDGRPTGVKPVWMSITADYTVGSSGGPVFNAAGEVVGMVSRTVTRSNAKRDEGNGPRRPLAGETIVFKDCVSAETLRRLLSGVDTADAPLHAAVR